MSERMFESLSAMLDGEANELELERVLASIGDDEALRRTWIRYAAARAVMDNQQPAQLGGDVSLQVRAAIAAAPQASRPEGLRRRLGRPLASFAVAASVAMVVVIGGQQLAQLNDASG
ncbi:MAG: sigma-E factor negative regulatory protein, partial [Halioglobus sp.]|nr:sigma-E factor negative regulatory protein [Halioglobus sp.]